MDNRKPTNSRLVPIPGSPDRSIHPFSAKRHQKNSSKGKFRRIVRRQGRSRWSWVSFVALFSLARSLAQKQIHFFHAMHIAIAIAITDHPDCATKWLHIMPPRSCDGLRRRRVNLLFGIDRLRRNWRIADTSNCSCYALPCIGLIGW